MTAFSSDFVWNINIPIVCTIIGIGLLALATLVYFIFRK